MRLFFSATAWFALLVLAASFSGPQASYAQSSGESLDRGPQIVSDGYMVYETDRSERVLYYFQIRSDTTAVVRQGRGKQAPAIIAPPFLLKEILSRVEDKFPTNTSEKSWFRLKYENRSFVFGFLQEFSLLILSGITVLIAGLAGIAFWFRRRMRQEREQRVASEAARRYLAEGREEERRRLAREIHDGPVQDLHALHLSLAGGGDGATSLDGLGDELMRVTSELRAMSADLHPPALERFGLAAALRSHAGRLEQRHDELTCALDVASNDESLAEETRLALFRIAQEAMSNAAEHASPSRIDLQLRFESDSVRLTITDDGCGFEVPDTFDANAADGHYGLLGMKERAESIGADLHVTSSSDDGTTVQVDAPVQPDRDRVAPSLQRAVPA
jgi:signal transduction histidine kinase